MAITIGCAGFPVPATRYFKEFLFVEIQETHLAVPGQGTLRRWKREAPDGFTFALLAPREIGLDGYKTSPAADTAIDALKGVGAELDAKLFVFTTPPELVSNRANKATVRDLLKRAHKALGGRVVWEAPPSWKPTDAETIARDAGVIAARDPLHHGTVDAPFAYYRLPGPAGHKSRYEDPAIERLGTMAASAKNDEALYVFSNVDMFADAKRLRRALKME
jgi:uncharacterized protein YecE (DUF72 family)